MPALLKMMVFCLFLPFSIGEIVLYHQFGLALVGSLYLGLCLQADHAARKFLKRSRLPAPAAQREEPLLKPLRLEPLGEKRARQEAPREIAEPQSAPKIEAKKTGSVKTASPNKKPRARSRPAPLPPNFSGSAHEVLGVSSQAATKTILKAFRHWIKRFHPDTAHGLPPATTSLRARQLNSAKEKLLSDRQNAHAKKTA